MTLTLALVFRLFHHTRGIVSKVTVSVVNNSKFRVCLQTCLIVCPAVNCVPGCDITRRDFSYKEGNAVCVQLAPSHSYTRSTAKAFIASLAEIGRCLQQLSSTPVSSSSCLAAGLGRRLPDYTLRYHDITIHWPTIS